MIVALCHNCIRSHIKRMGLPHFCFCGTLCVLLSDREKLIALASFFSWLVNSRYGWMLFSSGSVMHVLSWMRLASLSKTNVPTTALLMLHSVYQIFCIQQGLCSES